TAEVQHAVGERYEVLGLVGAGGMGFVYRARHRALGHIVAVKILPPEVAASEMRLKRFQQEAAQIGRASCRERVWSVGGADAVDGIRDRNVTGVQTCALPISPQRSSMPSGSATRSWASSAPAVWGSYTGLGTAPWATSSR